MCDKMGGFFDARTIGKTFGEWKRTVRNLQLCRMLVDRKTAVGNPERLRSNLMQWHGVVSLESKRRQIIGILQSRMPRKVIIAWTHSFVWRQCVDARSVSVMKGDIGMKYWHAEIALLVWSEGA